MRKVYDVDRHKKFMVICDNKIISKHVSFYLAQCAVERHLKNGRINNNYEIQLVKRG